MTMAPLLLLLTAPIITVIVERMRLTIIMMTEILKNFVKSHSLWCDEDIVVCSGGAAAVM